MERTNALGIKRWISFQLHVVLVYAYENLSQDRAQSSQDRPE